MMKKKTQVQFEVPCLCFYKQFGSALLMVTSFLYANTSTVYLSSLNVQQILNVMLTNVMQEYQKIQ